MIFFIAGLALFIAVVVAIICAITGKRNPLNSYQNTIDDAHQYLEQYKAAEQDRIRRLENRDAK